MSKVPSDLSYTKIIAALQRDGWVVTRHRKSSHIQLVKRVEERVLRLTIPAHKPVLQSTLAKILKSAELTVDRFLELL